MELIVICFASPQSLLSGTILKGKHGSAKINLGRNYSAAANPCGNSLIG